VITENGGFEVQGVVYDFLPAEPPESPPNTFSCPEGVFPVDPAQVEAYYQSQGKVIPWLQPASLSGQPGGSGLGATEPEPPPPPPTG
jgi:hypothetical protein